MNLQLTCNHCRKCYDLGKNAILFSNEFLHDKIKRSEYSGEKNAITILFSLYLSAYREMPGRCDVVMPISWWDRLTKGLDNDSIRVLSDAFVQDVINAFQSETNLWVCGKCYKSNPYPTSFAADLSSNLITKKTIMKISQFADSVRCVYCSQINSAAIWPRLGDAIPFYYQTKEETESKPGAYHVPVHCPKCGKDWFVAWDDDPR